ncbi:Uma2 family endonuclease [Scytonema sp. NUACC26]|uniref:Uma2 family endonuclease n=1 Tax=Scytonema sp. NUACC26 TaxID=3140176 RepID=UPI0034DBEB84
MSEIFTEIDIPPQFPDHTQLPESDGSFVKNFQEHPQCLILTDSITPVLQQLHPDGQYCIGQDCGIYWRETEPPEKGAEAPDWFYVPGVPPMLDGKIRRSYVFWREYIPPLIAIELASGNGDEERDATPLSLARRRESAKPGKFWVYQQIIRIPYYAIYEINNAKLEVYHLVDFSYQKLQPNERNHYPIPPLGVELGLWRGSYLNNPEQLWLRWWDTNGNLLLIGNEIAEQERQRAKQERQRAEQERQRSLAVERKATQLAERLRAMGIDPDTLE